MDLFDDINEDLSWLFYLGEGVIVLYIILYLIFIIIYNKRQNLYMRFINLKTIKIIYYLIILFITLYVSKEIIDNFYWNSLINIYNKIIILKLFVIILMIIINIIIYYSINKKEEEIYTELNLLILISLLGMFIIITTNDIFTLLLGIELQVMPYFIMCCIKKFSNMAIEAGLKYFIYGCYCSMISILGITMIYNNLGTTNLIEIYEILNITYIENKLYITNNVIMYQNTLFLGLIFFLVGLLFKLGVTPFQLWVPDVYEGSPNIITAYFIVISKITIVVAIHKVFFITFIMYITYIIYIFIICGMLSIVWGSIKALYEIKFKRYLGYSTIVHMGFILLSFSTGSLIGIEMSYFYLVTYIISTLTILIIWLNLSGINGLLIQNNTDFSIIKKTQINWAIIFSLSLLSLAGIPPCAGFYGKCGVFFALIDSGYYILAMFLLLISLLIVIYYIRIIRICLFEDLEKNIYFFFLNIEFKKTMLINFFLFINLFFMFLQVPIIIMIKVLNLGW